MRTENEKALLEACRRGEFEKIKNLLAIGTNPQFDLVGYPSNSIEMHDYKTPIGEIMHALYSEESIEIIRAFLDAGVNVNSYTHHTVNQTRSTPLGRALLTASGVTAPEIKQKVVDLLLSRGAQINLLSEEELVAFMGCGNPNLLESLLNAGLNPSTIAEGKTILEYVISAFKGSYGDNQAGMAKLLIKRGANLAVKNNPDQSLIQRTLRPDIAALLLEEDPHIFDGMTLHDSIILESPEFVEKLIARGDDLDSLNREGNTPLMESASLGFARAAFILINAGSKLNIRNKNGETALHLAFSRAKNCSEYSCDYTSDRRYPILLELYSKGAIPHLDPLGRTPLMRCHVTSRDYAAIEFCISEFSPFEAQYYSFDDAEYAKEMMNAYQSEMGKYAAFGKLPQQESPKHFFSERLVQKQPLAVVATLRENTVKKAIKDLLIAVKTNNEIAAGLVLKQFPEINVNVIADEQKEQLLNMAIRSVIHSHEDCRPLLALLIAAGADINSPDNSNLKETPLLATFNDRHHIDKRSLLFLLNNGANPNIANANNETALHLTARTFRSGGQVEETIETLLLYGADPDILSNTGKKPIDINAALPWEKNKIPLIFNKFKPQKHNIIDAALDLALSDKNRIIFAAALKNNLGIMVAISEHLPKVSILLSTLIESLQRREDLTPFSKNRLAFLKLLQNSPIVINKKEFSSLESEISGALIHRLYEADLDLISAVSSVSTPWEDTKKLHKAAAKIQFWYRKNKASISNGKLESIAYYMKGGTK